MQIDKGGETCIRICGFGLITRGCNNEFAGRSSLTGPLCQDLVILVNANGDEIRYTGGEAVHEWFLDWCRKKIQRLASCPRPALQPWSVEVVSFPEGNPKTNCNSIGFIVCESFASALGASGWQDLGTRMTRRAAEADKYEELLASSNNYFVK